VREVRFIHNPDIQQNLASDPQGAQGVLRHPGSREHQCQ
jgi:hypothetical protein